MDNEPCMVRPAPINLNIDKICPSIISLNRCSGSCNTLEDPFCRTCVPNKMEDVNLRIFSMEKGINESKTLLEHILCNKI